MSYTLTSMSWLLAEVSQTLHHLAGLYGTTYSQIHVVVVCWGQHNTAPFKLVCVGLYFPTLYFIYQENGSCLMRGQCQYVDKTHASAACVVWKMDMLGGCTTVDWDTARPITVQPFYDGCLKYWLNLRSIRSVCKLSNMLRHSNLQTTT